MPAPAPAPAMNPNDQNALASQIVRSQAVDMRQSVATGTVYPVSTPTINNIQPRYSGLIKRFWIKLSGMITNTGATTLTLTDWGLANLLNQVTLIDLNNYTRIQTTGQHLTYVSNAKRRHPLGCSTNFSTNFTTGGAYNLSQQLNVVPAIWPVFQASQTIASGATANFTAWFEVPCAYSNDNLRGAIYANVVNATMSLNFTFANSSQLVAAGTGDTNFAVYSGAAGSAANISSCTYTVYQDYLDQLPVNPKTGTVIVPAQDLSTVYELKNTNFTNISANQDFPIAYSNFRSFISTMAIFNNNGLASGRAYGSDINYWALRTANFTNLFQIDPIMAQLQAREILLQDSPAGTYYFDTRRAPIVTTQYGNMQLVLNPSSATGSAYCQIGWEDFAAINTLNNAGSLSAS